MKLWRIRSSISLYSVRLVIFFFFFSSRRRHTRFDCDWSSDVCSSDLLCRGGGRGALTGPAQRRGRQGNQAADHHQCGQRAVGLEAGGAGGAFHGGNRRSEEHTSELQSQSNLVCRLLLEKKKTTTR